MNPKRFWGTDMGEALRAVRASVGPDALILGTRNVTGDEGAGVEITVLADDDPEPRTNKTSPIAQLPSGSIEEVRQEIAALRSILCWLAPRLTHENEIIQTLIGQGLTPEIIARLAERLKSLTGGDDRERVFRLLTELIPSGGQIRGDAHECLALVGPAGVGKTTSIVKLTVAESQRRACVIGWVSIHNSNVGNDQLAVYASILGVQFEAASSLKELKRALERLADCDLVLIDTPGVSPRDHRALNALDKLLRSIPDLRRVLLLSAATNSIDMAEWVNTYGGAVLDSLFFTKLDECQRFGALINTALSSGRPVSYVSLGQNITGDLEAAKSSVLASLLLTGVDSHE